MHILQFFAYSVSFGDYLFLHFPCISIYQVRRFTTMKSILKLLLLFSPFHTNTSFLSTLFSGCIERKHRSKIDQCIQEAIIVSYGLFVEFEINLIFDTSKEVSFGRTLKFSWGLKGGISYEILSFTDTSSTKNFSISFWLVNRLAR